MRANWKYFIPAVIFGGYLLVSRGVPLGPVILGCAAAALANLYLSRRARPRHAPPSQ
jgi:hypothetical protein